VRLGKIFGSKRQEVMGGWREMCSEEANSPAMRTDEMGRTCSKQGAYEYKIFVRNSAGYRPFWRSRRIQEDATLRKTGREGADSIYLVHDRISGVP
jgi:hypothetical protein